MSALKLPARSEVFSRINVKIYDYIVRFGDKPTTLYVGAEEHLAMTDGVDEPQEFPLRVVSVLLPRYMEVA